MIELLAKKTIKKVRYTHNDDRMDCLQSAYLDMYSNWHNFNEEKSDNAFAYFTEIFKRGIAKSLNQLTLKKGDTKRTIRIVSIESSNEGNGLHSI